MPNIGVNSGDSIETLRGSNNPKNTCDHTHMLGRFPAMSILGKKPQGFIWRRIAHEPDSSETESPGLGSSMALV